MAGNPTMLLLGAASFVGGHLRAAAERSGLTVVGTSRTEDGAELACDLLDPASIEKAVDAVKPQLVVNMAGSASVRRSWDDPKHTFAVNVGGTQNILEAVDAKARSAHVLCVSSAEVYGEVEPEELPLTEEHAVSPVSPYSESKAAMEELCERYANSRGLQIAVVRAFNQLGPGQGPDFVASDFALQIAAAEVEGASEVTMRVGNLSAARDFTDVRDSARAFLAVSERQLTGTFNMCSGVAVKVESLLEHMRRDTSLEVRVETDPDLIRPVDVPTLYGAPDRLREATGWKPEIPLGRSIADLLDWWRVKLA